MTPARPDDKLAPPFRVVAGAESFYVEDAAGNCFGYCYYDARPFVGTGRENRLSRDTARRMAQLIARLPELLAETKKAPGAGAPGA